MSYLDQMTRCWMIPTNLWLRQRKNSSCWISLQSLEPHWMRFRGERAGEHCPHELGLPYAVCTGNLVIQHLLPWRTSWRQEGRLLSWSRQLVWWGAKHVKTPQNPQETIQLGVISTLSSTLCWVLTFWKWEIIRGISMNKYSVMSMVDIATGFHMCEVVKEGGGQPTSEACAKALMTKWIAWAGWLAGQKHASWIEVCTTEVRWPRCCPVMDATLSLLPWKPQQP